MIKRKGKKGVLAVMKAANPYFYIMPVMVLLLILMAVPIVQVIRYSFYKDVLFGTEEKFAGFINYVKVAGARNFGRVLSNTLVFSVLSTVFHLLLGMLLAVLLNKKGNRFVMGTFRVIFILPWVFTAAAVAISWEQLLAPLGVFNYYISYIFPSLREIAWLGNAGYALPALVIINTWRGYPICMVSFLSGLQSIPVSLYEAAQIDSASSIQSFFRITVPMLKPIILSVALLDIIQTLNLFPLVWLTTGGGPNGASEMLATQTYKYAFTDFDMGLASALGVIALILTGLLTIFYVRNQKAV